MKSTRVCLMLLVVAMSLSAATNAAQQFPLRPIRILTTEVGGGNDYAARVIAQGLSTVVGQPVIVDNRGGGGGVLAGEMLVKALPDGYTLLLHGSTIWLLQYMRDNVPWDPLKDVAPVTVAVRSPYIIVVDPVLPAKSIQELIALAKAKPGALSYGTGSVGSTIHIAAELFTAMAGVNIVRVNYKGGAPAITALLGGQVQMLVTTIGGASPHIKANRMRALALTSAQPSPLFPGLPTVAASGLPGYEAVTLVAMFAPASTPTAVLDTLNANIVQVLNKPETRDKFLNAGVETVGSTPRQLSDVMKSEMTRLGKVITDAHIRAD